MRRMNEHNNNSHDSEKSVQRDLISDLNDDFMGENNLQLDGLELSENDLRLNDFLLPDDDQQFTDIVLSEDDPEIINIVNSFDDLENL